MVEASGAQLIAAALVGVAAIVLLISGLKLHPFLGLTCGSLLVGALAGGSMTEVVVSFSNGVGSTVAGVGTLIALGAMLGRLLADSGGADRLVDTIVARSSPRGLPWTTAAIGALIGLPMFFESGLVLIMPVLLGVARRAGVSLISIGIPALAGLSAMHGFTPPHPGPLAAIGSLRADLGITLGLGVAVAIPTIIVSGPLFARLASRWVDVPPPALFDGGPSRPDRRGRRRPSFAVALITVLLPVVLMMAKALAVVVLADDGPLRHALDVIGTPLVALLIAVLVAIVTLGIGSGMDRIELSKTLERGLPPIAGILLIVAAGGGFKQTLVDTGIAQVIASYVAGSPRSILLLAWGVAAIIRLATGSATVATVTAAGILSPLAGDLASGEASLLVLAIGAGSIFFSHVNDAGFWLVKEYFGLGVGQTIKTWSLMETVLSVFGLIFVFVVQLII